MSGYLCHGFHYSICCRCRACARLWVDTHSTCTKSLRFWSVRGSPAARLGAVMKLPKPGGRDACTAAGPGKEQVREMGKLSYNVPGILVRTVSS